VRFLHVSPILNVSDVEASLAWFERLGWERGFTWPRGAGEITFAAVTGAGHTEIFLCLGGQGARGGPSPKFVGDDETGGVWMSWWVSSPSDVDAVHERAVELGYEVAMPPKDESWGVREFHLRHPDGHTFRVSAAR
jgi:catechol 2,3-dioxygenase-like lactoylglutathione lyase family enzyme